MPDKHKLSSTVRRRGLVKSFCPSVPMRECRNCKDSKPPKKCLVGGSSDKCVECARGAIVCDLAPFSPVRWARIEKQRKEKSEAYKEAMAKAMRLHAEMEALEKMKLDMVENELQNIEEVEVDERLASIDPSNFFFDVSSEQIEVPPGFDFAGLTDIAGTAVEASGSSQDS